MIVFRLVCFQISEAGHRRRSQGTFYLSPCTEQEESVHGRGIVGSNEEAVLKSAKAASRFDVCSSTPPRVRSRPLPNQRSIFNASFNRTFASAYRDTLGQHANNCKQRPSERAPPSHGLTRLLCGSSLRRHSNYRPHRHTDLCRRNLEQNGGSTSSAFLNSAFASGKTLVIIISVRQRRQRANPVFSLFEHPNSPRAQEFRLAST